MTVAIELTISLHNENTMSSSGPRFQLEEVRWIPYSHPMAEMLFLFLTLIPDLYYPHSILARSQAGKQWSLAFMASDHLAWALVHYLDKRKYGL